ncbi:predicted protein [Botrytis cinerea T4]|uniref:Uncharacterized protein n=1 Tax=Botryotinia fuckeliana (strain T4) TaxID=999810 RepID=G2YSS8_BOTF4|nr:predicted protein [Botrytis cinerea T4]
MRIHTLVYCYLSFHKCFCEVNYVHSISPGFLFQESKKRYEIWKVRKMIKAKNA